MALVRCYVNIAPGVYAYMAVRRQLVEKLGDPDSFGLFYRRNFTLHKALYIVMRYYSTFVIIFCFKYISVPDVELTDEFCRFWFWFEGFHTSVFPLGTGEMMQAMRLCALYHDSPRARLLVRILYAGSLIGILVGWSANAVSLRPSASTLPPPFNGCNTSPPRFVTISLAVGIWNTLVNVLYLAMMVRQSLKSKASNLCLRDQRKLMPILYIMTRDGTVWFFMTTCVQALSIFDALAFTNRKLIALYNPFVITAHAISACRLLLNLRASIGGYGPSSAKTIQFPEDVPLDILGIGQHQPGSIAGQTYPRLQAQGELIPTPG
ncbi:hypothetical protein PUNSTDRAFT_133622 [Punctularia strigosozonata HHB-11173 SS5]|uniref:uncharacterized protein n=1 Tax=Punctularia strigosozonata (strain HHB-11173) TaxID=741275 RepID=UPI0004417AE8|nr:uncharacterized protein PUNSTDRAFT_133622 [Punctularia strigosozonata HHB-11173 SS5]EIN09849.1 hypothetical protein PUNSTDRAFT_133622 [Punctularia strigosozonata HHB-11173 SS5]